MLLGAQALRAALADGSITCDPAPRAIESVHIDVHLGSLYWVPDVKPIDRIRQVASILFPFIAPPIITIDDTADPLDYYIPRTAHDGYLVLPPFSTVLAHTHEAIGSNSASIVPILHTRSTFARWGFSAHTSAGWGDPGFNGVWTLELVNHHPITRRIPVGIRIGCIAFERVEENDDLYRERYLYDRSSFSWRSMLPRKSNLS